MIFRKYKFPNLPKILKETNNRKVKRKHIIKWNKYKSSEHIQIQNGKMLSWSRIFSQIVRKFTFDFFNQLQKR